MPGIIIIFEGCIGAGKTTLVDSLKKNASELFPGQEVVVMREDIQGNLLDLYLGDIPKYAFPFQVIVARDRVESFKKAQKLADAGKVVIMDRGLAGDYAFAKMQHSGGLMSDAEFEVYKTMVMTGNQAMFPRAPDGEREEAAPGSSGSASHKVIIFYLETDPSVAFKRMKKRGNKGEVETYTLQYFKELTQAHSDVLKEMACMKEAPGVEAHGTAKLISLQYSASLKVSNDGFLELPSVTQIADMCKEK